MTEERKETMEQKTTRQPTLLHKLNVYGWYFTSAIDFAIALWFATGFFGLEFSTKVWVLGTIAGSVLYYAITSKEEIQETLGLFIRYSELRVRNKHVILDILLLLTFGYLVQCAVLYIMALYFWEVFLTISPDAMQVLLLLCVVLNAAKSISKRYRESLEQ